MVPLFFFPSCPLLLLCAIHPTGCLIHHRWFSWPSFFILLFVPQTFFVCLLLMCRTTVRLFLFPPHLQSWCLSPVSILHLAESPFASCPCSLASPSPVAFPLLVCHSFEYHHHCISFSKSTVPLSSFSSSLDLSSPSKLIVAFCSWLFLRLLELPELAEVLVMESGEGVGLSWLVRAELQQLSEGLR